jgi:hypothetical protein
MEPTFRERVVFGSFDYHSTFTEAGGTDAAGAWRPPASSRRAATRSATTTGST